MSPRLAQGQWNQDSTLLLFKPTWVFSPPGYTYDCISFVYPGGLNPRRFSFLFFPASVTSWGQPRFGRRKTSGGSLVGILGKKELETQTASYNSIFLFINSLLKEFVCVWISWGNNAIKVTSRKPLHKNLNLQNGFVYSFHKYFHLVCDPLTVNRTN